LRILWKIRGSRPMVAKTFYDNVLEWGLKLISDSNPQEDLQQNSLASSLIKIPFIGKSLLKYFGENIRFIIFVTEYLNNIHYNKQIAKKEIFLYLSWINNDNWFDSLEFKNYDITIFIPLFYENPEKH